MNHSVCRSCTLVCYGEEKVLICQSMYIAGFRIHLIEIEFTLSECLVFQTLGSGKVNEIFMNS